MHLTYARDLAATAAGIANGLVAAAVVTRDLPTARPGKHEDCVTAIEANGQLAAKRASGSSFYPAHADHAARHNARRCLRSIHSAARWTTLPMIAGPRETRLAAIAAMARGRRRSLCRQAAPHDCGLVVPRSANSGSQREDFLAIIDGMEMDVVADIRAPDSATLDLYCDRVASAVGRLSVAVFGLEPSDGIALAHHLGRALQLTNILRDLDEDAGIGRLYLPREALTEAGITATRPGHGIVAVPTSAGVPPRADRARQAISSMPTPSWTRYPRRIVRTPRLMGEVYKLKLRQPGDTRLGAASAAGPQR